MRRTEVITRLQPEAKEKSGRRDSLISNYLKATKSADDRALDLFLATKFKGLQRVSTSPLGRVLYLKALLSRGPQTLTFPKLNLTVWF